MPLRWQEADAGTRRDLPHFTCAHPPEATRDPWTGWRHHDRPYQLSVQSYIRGSRPPKRDGTTMLVGYDGDRLAGVIEYESVGVGDDPPAFFVTVIARDSADRAVGAGDELIEALIAHLRERNARDRTNYGVYGKVDDDNRACRELMKRHGFEVFDREGCYEFWGRDL